MRKSNSAKTSRDCPEKQSGVKSSGESPLQGSRVACKRWSTDRLASALFLALRWFVYTSKWIVLNAQRVTWR
jgi:hypothetical protein